MSSIVQENLNKEGGAMSTSVSTEHGSAHDPLCPVASTEAEIYWRPRCPYCTVISRVREDERDKNPIAIGVDIARKARERAEQEMFPHSVVEDVSRKSFDRGWNDALTEARDAIAALLGWQHGLAMTAITKHDALAAIDALKEEIPMADRPRRNR